MFTIKTLSIKKAINKTTIMKEMQKINVKIKYY